MYQTLFSYSTLFNILSLLLSALLIHVVGEFPKAFFAEKKIISGNFTPKTENGIFTQCTYLLVLIFLYDQSSLCWKTI